MGYTPPPWFETPEPPVTPGHGLDDMLPKPPTGPPGHGLDDMLPSPPPEPPAPPKAAPPRAPINAVARPIEYRLDTVTAKDTPIPIIYGRDKIGAKVLAATIVGNSAVNAHLLLSAGWCLGEVDSVEKIFVNDVSTTDPDIARNITVTTYLGTTTQGVDPTLSTHITDYADDNITTMPNGDKVGTCYTVILLNRYAINGFPKLTAIIKGFKVYDPREAGHDANDRSTWEWSDNPALHINDFIQSENYGANRVVDQSTVSTLADRNDKIIDVDSSTVLRSLNLTLDRTTKTEQWVDVLRGYAACFVVQTNDGIALAADAPTSVTASVTASQIVADSFQPVIRGLLNSPTVLKVTYTEENIDSEWTDEVVEVSAPGVANGTIPRIVSDVHLQGIHSHQQALREATIRFNHFHAEDLEVTYDTFDEGLKRLEGDVIHVDHPIGVSQNFRVTKITNPSPGRWRLGCVEYQPAVYSSLVIDKAPNPDTNLPDPSNVPSLTGLKAVEEIYQLPTGEWAVRIRITWDDPPVAYPYTLLYTVRLLDQSLARFVWQDTGKIREIVTPSLRDLSRDSLLDLTYSIYCYAHTDNGFTGTEQQIEITTLGKTAIPGDVPEIDGYELAGDVRLFWSPAIDLDISRYQVRYGATNTWGDMTKLDTTPGLRGWYGDIPEGTWYFSVKAIDSIGQFSDNAATIQIIVTLNTEAYLTHIYDFDFGGSTDNVVAYTKDRMNTDSNIITTDGSSIADTFPGALNTYVGPMGVYHAPALALWESSTIDFGVELGGKFDVMYDEGFTLEESFGNDVSASLFLALTNSANTQWRESSGLALDRTIRYHNHYFRYAKFKVESHSSATMHITIPKIRLRVGSQYKEENGTILTYANEKTLACDGSAYAVFANSSAVNLQAAGYSEKTLEATFITGASVTDMQIIYEQGDVSVGMSLGVEVNILWGFVYDNDKYIHVQTSILPNTQYMATMRFKSSVLVMALNGVSVTQNIYDAQQELPSNLPIHTGSCCVGGVQGGTYFVGAYPGDGYIFSGKIFRVSQYNRYLTDSEVSANAVNASVAVSTVMDYNANNGTGTVLPDSSDNSNDASVAWGAAGTDWEANPLGKAVITKYKYFEANRITLLPKASEARFASFDNIIYGRKVSWLNYAWDSDGSATETSVAWEFKGL